MNTASADGDEWHFLIITMATGTAYRYFLQTCVKIVTDPDDRSTDLDPLSTVPTFECQKILRRNLNFLKPIGTYT